MSTAPKKGFAAFIRPAPPPEEPSVAAAPSVETHPPPAAPALVAPVLMVQEQASPLPAPRLVPPTPTPVPAPVPAAAPTARIRQVTSTGRVRTHSANRMLPGVTLRLSEERWERLKILSIQERRPIQDILGEAMDAFMRGRGLPW